MAPKRVPKWAPEGRPRPPKGHMGALRATGRSRGFCSSRVCCWFGVALGEPRAAFRGPFWHPFCIHFGTIFEHFFGALIETFGGTFAHTPTSRIPYKLQYKLHPGYTQPSNLHPGPSIHPPRVLQGSSKGLPRFLLGSPQGSRHAGTPGPTCIFLGFLKVRETAGGRQEGRKALE